VRCRPCVFRQPAIGGFEPLGKAPRRAMTAWRIYRRSQRTRRDGRVTRMFRSAGGILVAAALPNLGRASGCAARKLSSLRFDAWLRAGHCSSRQVETPALRRSRGEGDNRGRQGGAATADRDCLSSWLDPFRSLFERMQSLRLCASAVPFSLDLEKSAQQELCPPW